MELKDYRFFIEYVKEARDMMKEYGDKYYSILNEKKKNAFVSLFSIFSDKSIFINEKRYFVRRVCFDNDSKAVYLNNSELKQHVDTIYSHAILRNPKSVSKLRKLSNLHCQFKNYNESSMINPTGTYYQIQGRDIVFYNSLLRISLWMKWIALSFALFFFALSIFSLFEDSKKASCIIRKKFIGLRSMVIREKI